MNPDRERAIERICQEALERPRGERATFLADACAGDEELRREVEQLLAHESAASAFLATSALAVAAHQIGRGGNALRTGQQIGSYTILSSLGSGGMGEVYRARDAALGREVAIKVLPPGFTSDSERLVRFEREARVLAALNHPNIATIYGVERADGVHALVLEIVEGETLEERIRRGGSSDVTTRRGRSLDPPAMVEALAIAKQIADALEAAHEKNIVHRDLKPANIKIRPDGVVKVLDFGLAKAVPAETSGPDRSRSQTLTDRMSGGVLLGTAAYMSPEQVRGQPVDKRADIWAFGCVLYEMLTGRVAFAGETVSDTITAILGRDVDWSTLPEATPPSVYRLLNRCLNKQSARRLRDIGDARLELEEAVAVPSIAPQGTSRWAARAGWVAAAAFCVTAIALGAGIWTRPSLVDARAYRTEMLMPVGFEASGPPGRFAISPDGRRLAFTARDETGKLLLWVRALDEPTPRPLPGTDGAEHPFWSPDSRVIAFYANKKLKKIAAAGGASFTLCDAGEFAQGGTWNRDDVILFNFGHGPLFRVAADGGTPEQVTTLDQAAQENGHAFPFFLPDGRRFVYTAYSFERTVADRGLFVGGVYAGSLDSADRTQLLDFISHAEYARGHLLFVRDAALVAQPLDLARMAMTGEPLVLAEQVNVLVRNAPIGAFSMSEGGTLAFEGLRSDSSQLVWVDRRGRRLETLGSPANYGNWVQLSTDGTRALVVRSEADAAPDVVVLDTSGGAERRLTSDPAIDATPVWSPDGTRVAFARRSKGPYAVRLTASSGSGTEEVLVSDDVNTFAESWSPDGQFLLYMRNDDLWVLPIFGERKPFLFLGTPSIEWEAQFSPDGRWVAYTSFESGRYEVYVSPFSGALVDRSGAPLGKWPVSRGAGHAARWRRDGKEIFYWAPDTKKLMAVSVRADGPRLDLGRAEPLFDARPRLESYPFTFYDVSADGQRFLISGVDTHSGTASIEVIVNWPALVKN